MGAIDQYGMENVVAEIAAEAGGGPVLGGGDGAGSGADGGGKAGSGGDD